MTEDELKAIEARADAATGGPWLIIVEGLRPRVDGERISGFGDVTVATFEVRDPPDPNCEFIAHARTDVPALLDALRESRATSALHVEAAARAMAERDAARADIMTVMHGAIDGTRALRDECQAALADVARLEKERDNAIALAEGDRATYRANIDAHKRLVQDMLFELVGTQDVETETDAVALVKAAVARAERAEASVGALREACDKLNRVANRVVLTVPKRDNPHHDELSRAVGLSIGPLADTEKAGAEFVTRIKSEQRGELESATRGALVLMLGCDPMKVDVKDAIAEYNARVRAEALEEAATWVESQYPDSDWSRKDFAEGLRALAATPPVKAGG